MTERLTKENIVKYMKHGGAFSFDVRDEVTSTNALAKEAALGGEKQFRVFTAQSQTAGRGRLSRSFYSPAGTGLYMSVILRPESIADVTMITSGAAVIMADAIEECFGICADIKWVNDLYLAGKKVCGILTEASFSGGENPDFVILGAGVNVYPPEGGFPDEVRDVAGALLAERTTDAKARLAAAFLDRLYEKYGEIFRGGHMDEYRRRCRMVGERVDVVSGEKSFAAKILSINDDCSLTVETEDGECQKIFSGEVSVRKKTVEK